MRTVVVLGALFVVGATEIEAAEEEPSSEESTASSEESTASSDGEGEEPSQHQYRKTTPLDLVLVLDRSPSVLERERAIPEYVDALKRFIFEVSDGASTVEVVEVDRSAGRNKNFENRQAAFLAGALADAKRRLDRMPDFHKRAAVLVTDLDTSAENLKVLGLRADDLYASEMALYIMFLGRGGRDLFPIAYRRGNKGFAQRVGTPLGLFTALYSLLKKNAEHPAELLPVIADTTRVPVPYGTGLVQIDVLHGRAREKDKVLVKDPKGQVYEPRLTGRYHQTFVTQNPAPGMWEVSAKGRVEIRSVGVVRIGAYRAASEGQGVASGPADPIPDYMMNFDPTANTQFVFLPPEGGNPAGTPITLTVKAVGGPIPENVSVSVEVTRPDETTEVIEIPRVGKRLYRGEYEATEVGGKYSFKMSYSPGYIAAQREAKAEVDTKKQPPRPKTPKPKYEPPPRPTEGQPLVDQDVEAPPPEETSSGMGWLPFALVPLLLGGGVGFFLWRRRRAWQLDDEDDEAANEDQEEFEIVDSAGGAGGDAESAEDVTEEEESDQPVALDTGTSAECFLQPMEANVVQVAPEVERFLRDVTVSVSQLYFDLCGNKWQKSEEMRAFAHTGTEIAAWAELDSYERSGRFGLLFNADGAADIARAMFGLPDDEPVDEEFLNDAVDEFVNLCLGKLKAMSEDPDSTIGLPQRVDDVGALEALRNGIFQPLKEAKSGGQAAIVWLEDEQVQVAAADG
ncbi:MAG: chemotaxis protein CheX [Myxococcota bacterium]